MTARRKEPPPRPAAIVPPVIQRLEALLRNHPTSMLDLAPSYIALLKACVWDSASIGFDEVVETKWCRMCSRTWRATKPDEHSATCPYAAALDAVAEVLK